MSRLPVGYSIVFMPVFVSASSFPRAVCAATHVDIPVGKHVSSRVGLLPRQRGADLSVKDTWLRR